MPTHHLLTINFDEAGLQALRAAGQKVAIARSVEPFRQEQMVWLSFFPRLVSTVTWTEEDVRLYAFLQTPQWPLQPGTQILMSGYSEAVVPGGVYSFSFEGKGMGGFQKESDEGAAGRYTLVQQEQRERRIFGFGLAGAGTLFSEDEKTKLLPLNIAPLPYNSLIPFRVTKKVQVFTSAADPSVILGNEPKSGVLELDFSQTLSWTIRYDSKAHRFVHQ